MFGIFSSKISGHKNIRHVVFTSSSPKSDIVFAFSIQGFHTTRKAKMFVSGGRRKVMK
jgi:hypothetical protein